MPHHKVIRNMGVSGDRDPSEEDAFPPDEKSLENRGYGSLVTKLGKVTVDKDRYADHPVPSYTNDTATLDAAAANDDALSLSDSDTGDEFAEDNDWSSSSSFAGDDFAGADEDKYSHRVVPLIPETNRADRPPCRPSRCFEGEYAELKRINENSKARRRGGRRDELAQSEHVGGALRDQSDHSPPMHPTSRTPPIAPTPLVKAKDDCLGSLPPSGISTNRRRYKDQLSVSEHTGQKHRRTASGSQLGKVTLRASHNRVLRGTRELSTSEHLRRQAPSRQ